MRAGVEPGFPQRAPGEICFLFGDRAHRQAEVKHRVDSVVKGLLSVGIHHGERGPRAIAWFKDPAGNILALLQAR